MMTGIASKAFFFEKKNQKTSVNWRHLQRRCQIPSEIKVFLLLFFQKKQFFLHPWSVSCQFALSERF
jgi:hypothetical protein